ncbi:MAG: hypothetical protein WBQ20_07535 [Methyloceanibacter sp.]
MRALTHGFFVIDAWGASSGSNAKLSLLESLMDCPGRPAELEKEELSLVRIRGIRAAGAYIVVPRLQESEAPYGQSAYHAANHFGVLQSQFGDWWGPVQQWIEFTTTRALKSSPVDGLP